MFYTATTATALLAATQAALDGKGLGHTATLVRGHAGVRYSFEVRGTDGEVSYALGNTVDALRDSAEALLAAIA